MLADAELTRPGGTDLPQRRVVVDVQRVRGLAGVPGEEILRCVEGDRRLLKVTTQDDLELVSSCGALATRRPRSRITTWSTVCATSAWVRP